MNNLLNLSREIFDLEAICRAISDYAKICRIQLGENDDYFCCEFYDNIYPLEQTKKEFENYLIAIENAGSFK